MYTKIKIAESQSKFFTLLNEQNESIRIISDESEEMKTKKIVHTKKFHFHCFLIL